MPNYKKLEDYTFHRTNTLAVISTICKNENIDPYEKILMYGGFMNLHIERYKRAESVHRFYVKEYQGLTTDEVEDIILNRFGTKLIK
jgi:hypothetical protein